MQPLILLPFQQVGPLRFGMSRQDTREVLHEDWHSFLKGPNAIIFTDAYDTLGLHLYFDDSEHLECIEAFSPSRVVYDGVQLIDRDSHDVSQELTNLGCICRSDDGIFCDAQGFSLYAPDHIVLAVTMYARSYDM